LLEEFEELFEELLLDELLEEFDELLLEEFDEELVEELLDALVEELLEVLLEVLVELFEEVLVDTFVVSIAGTSAAPRSTLAACAPAAPAMSAAAAIVERVMDFVMDHLRCATIVSMAGTTTGAPGGYSLTTPEDAGAISKPRRRPPRRGARTQGDAALRADGRG
jgi:hypothetical protein